MDTGPQGSVTALGAHGQIRGADVKMGVESSPAVEPVGGPSRGPFVAGAPISWGICEVPGWGPMLPAERVLSEMHELGLSGTELGAPGFLPDEPDAVRAAVSAHGLTLVGAFVPLVLWSADADDSAAALAQADLAAAKLAAGAGANPALPPPALNVALVEDLDWSRPHELSDDEWALVGANLTEVERICATHRVTMALHPHFDTLLERDDQIQRALVSFDPVGWCLDTGHLTIAGTDPAAFARVHGHRVSHAHLKDVDATLARRLAAREMTLLEATKKGLFRPLGEGDVNVAGTLAQLRAHGYAGWLVLEQDTSLTGDEPPVSVMGPMGDVRTSIAFMENLAQQGEEKVI
jgi:inosose dehydratase